MPGSIFCSLSLPRKPSATEREACSKLLQSQRKRLAGKAGDAEALLRIGDAPKDPNLDPVEVAAWAQGCRDCFGERSLHPALLTNLISLT